MLPISFFTSFKIFGFLTISVGVVVGFLEGFNPATLFSSLLAASLLGFVLPGLNPSILIVGVSLLPSGLVIGTLISIPFGLDGLTVIEMLFLSTVEPEGKLSK